MTTRIWNLPQIELKSLSELEEARPVAMIYSSAALAAISDRLHLPVVWQAEVLEAVDSHWEHISSGLEGEIVYAVGGGLAADAAKYVAARRQLPLVCIPTALSVDAFLTWASGVRREGCVYYIDTKPADRLVVDFAVLAAAPKSLRAAGICDVLSIATGLWDWHLADQRGENPPEMAYVAYIDQAAWAILQGALECAEAAGRGDRDGLKQLLDCLALEVQLCNLIGHARPEEGSEHYFAYCVENALGKGMSHGDLVGPGIVLMAEFQGQNTGPLRRALRACNIDLTRIPEEVIRATLRALPAYVRQHRLPYGIAHELTDEYMGPLPSLD